MNDSSGEREPFLLVALFKMINLGLNFLDRQGVGGEGSGTMLSILQEFTKVDHKRNRVMGVPVAEMLAQRDDTASQLCSKYCIYHDIVQ